MIKAQFIVYTIAQRIVVAIGSQVHHFFRSSILEAHIPQLICDVPAIINLVKIKIEIISRGTKAALHILIGCEFWYEDDPAGGCIRFPTELECERLMGLPEGWTKYGADGGEISASQRYRALGNAIALPCAEYIMAGIAEALR